VSRRGRPTRAATAATRRIEVRCTPGEYAAIRRLASAHGSTMADWLRLGALTAAGDDGADPPVILGGSLQDGIIAD
jgi:hypothetical protein